MKLTAESFANGTSGGIISGCIGAIDGWLIKIVAPSYTMDNVRNGSSFLQSKGLFCLECPGCC